MTKPASPALLSRLPPDEELARYFGSAERDHGIGSNFEPLVALAFGGMGGSRDPDRRMVALVDRRHRPGGVSHDALVRRALRTVPSRSVVVLAAAYGPEDWRAIADASFGRGTGTRLRDRVGALLGVALLSDALAKGHAARMARMADARGELVCVERRLTAKQAESWAAEVGIISDRFDAYRVPAKAKADAPKAKPLWLRRPHVLDTVGGHLLLLAEGREPGLEAVLRETRASFDSARGLWREAWAREAAPAGRRGGKDAPARLDPGVGTLPSCSALYGLPDGS